METAYSPLNPLQLVSLWSLSTSNSTKAIVYEFLGDATWYRNCCILMKELFFCAPPMLNGWVTSKIVFTFTNTCFDVVRGIPGYVARVQCTLHFSTHYPKVLWYPARDDFPQIRGSFLRNISTLPALQRTMTVHLQSAAKSCLNNSFYVIYFYQNLQQLSRWHK